MERNFVLHGFQEWGTAGIGSGIKSPQRILVWISQDFFFLPFSSLLFHSFVVVVVVVVYVYIYMLMYVYLYIIVTYKVKLKQRQFKILKLKNGV